MSAKIIAIANMKGGVGKTTTTVSISEAFAADGYKVLVIDLDAQASASVCLAGDELLAKLVAENRTVEALLENQLIGNKKMKLADCIRSNVSNVIHRNDQLPISLFPSSPKLRSLEFKMIHNLTNNGFGWDKIVAALFSVIEKQLRETRSKFDYVIIDCAPGISIMTEAAVRLADLVIVPTIPDFLSTYGLQAFCTVIWERGMTSKKAHKPKARPRVLVTRKREIASHLKTIEILEKERTTKDPKFDLFITHIKEAAAVTTGLGLGRIEAEDGKIKNTDMISGMPVVQYLKKWGPEMPTLLDRLKKEIEGA